MWLHQEWPVILQGQHQDGFSLHTCAGRKTVLHMRMQSPWAMCGCHLQSRLGWCSPSQMRNTAHGG